MLPNAPALLLAASLTLSSISGSFAANLAGTVRDLESHADPDRLYVARTDEHGFFRLDDISEGTYKLELLATGFKSKSFSSIAVDKGRDTVDPYAICM
jgi:hypothetical protein